MIFVRKCSPEYSQCVSVCLCNAGNGRKFTRSNVQLRNSYYERNRLEEHKCFYFSPEIIGLGKCTSNMTRKHLVLQNLTHLCTCVDLDNLS